MTTRTLLSETNVSYSITFTCLNWMPLFELVSLYDDIYKWFDIVQNAGNKLLGYVIMPNHLHAMILFNQLEITINDLIAEGKKFRAWEIIKRLRVGGFTNELELLKLAVLPSDVKKGSVHKVFEESFDAKTCYNSLFIQQKLNYYHFNPVKAGIVELPEDYIHSSAKYYITGEQGVYPVTDYLDYYSVLPG